MPNAPHQPGAILHHAEKGEQHKGEHQTVEMAADPEFDDQPAGARHRNKM